MKDDFNNDEYYFLQEFFNDNEVLEICQSCLRLRLFSCTWIRPEENILSFFISIKKEHILTECPDCLHELYFGKIKL